MAVTTADLWRLLKQSRLLTAERLEQVRVAFDQAGVRTRQDSARSLASWLLRQQLLTAYQANVLLNGRAGPFFYGDYRIEDRVRGGRLGGLFHARHEPSGHQVLLKFVSSRIAQNPRQWQVARQHLRTVSTFIHPQLQRVFSLEDLAGYRFLVLEQLDGTSLDLRLGVVHQLAFSPACRVARLVAAGLAELHQRRQVHGDVRPDNIWLDAEERVKLIRDRVMPPSVPEFSQPGLTPAELAQADYLAPELTRPGIPLSAATDIYALGCTLFEMLAGQPPFPAQSPQKTLQRHVHEAPDFMPISRVPGEPVPEDLVQLVNSMLAKDAVDRPQLAEDVVQQLTPFIEIAQRAIPTGPVPATLADFEQSLGQAKSIPPAPPPWFAEPEDHPPIAPPPIQVDLTGQETPAPSAPLEAVAVPPPPPPPVTDVVPPAARRPAAYRLQRVRRERRRRAITLSAIAGTVLLVALGLSLLSPTVRQSLFGHKTDSSSSPAPTQREVAIAPSDASTSAKSADGDPIRELSDRFQIRPDDGQLLWKPPTLGPPLELQSVPPGAQFVLVARPQALLALPQGDLIWESLGPDFLAAAQSWESSAAVPLKNVARFTLTWHDAAAGPQVFFLVRPASSLTREQLLASWGHPPGIDYQNQIYYQAHGWSFYIPGTDDSLQFAMGSEAQIREVIDQGNHAPVLRRELSQLLQNSDSEQHVTLLFTPHFLTSRLLASSENPNAAWERLSDALDWLLSDDASACLVSMQFADPSFFELRATGRTARDALTIGQSLTETVGQIPDRLERFLGQVDPSAYWRRVAVRFPMMIRFLHRYARVGIEDDQAIVNAVLPLEAAHNLIFSGEMLLHAQADMADSPGHPAPGPTGPQTIDQLLAAPMSLRFAQTSLEFAVRDLANQVREVYPTLPFPFDIQISGKDLQLNGITRNQEISSFDAANIPLSDVLTALVRRANPVTTVTQASDPDQKLVWVVGPDPADPKKQILLITTREAVAREGFKLPGSFLPE